MKSPISVRIDNGEQILAQGKGMIKIETLVLYVPSLKLNLFSLKLVAKKGVNFLLFNHGERCLFTRDGNVIAPDSDSGSLYKFY